MNQHILIAMDHKNRDKEELIENYQDAAAAVAAFDVSVIEATFAAAWADVVRAARAAQAAADADADDDYVEYWLNRYFEITGENREEYEKALEEMRK